MARAATLVGISLQTPGSDFVRCEPVPNETPDKLSCIYLLKENPQAPRSLRFEFGYSRARATRIASVLGVLLTLPVIATFWFRRRALSIPEAARPTLSFAHRRFLTWTGTLGVVA